MRPPCRCNSRPCEQPAVRLVAWRWSDEGTLRTEELCDACVSALRAVRVGDGSVRAVILQMHRLVTA
jgi:hypothetical protein